MSLVLRDVEIGGARTDVTIEGGIIAAIGRAEGRGVREIAGAGGGLVPGLWDHHLHLLATAAALESVPAGPPDVVHEAGLAAALRDADRALEPGRWLRAVGYHESVAGPLDHRWLDRVVPGRPVRVQHRSGAQWTLNGVGCDRVGLDDADAAGIDRDPSGRPTGRLVGLDDWLRQRLGEPPPDLAAVGRRLAERGVVGVTDATPDRERSGWEIIAGAVRSDRLRQHVVVMGGPELAAVDPPAPLRAGPVKLYLADHSLPSLADLVDRIGRARRAGRAVAFHSVTVASLALALTARSEAGPAAGDRIEHGSVIPPDLSRIVAESGATVVTQPGLVAERGDEYRSHVEGVDLPHLYPCASLLDAGIPVGGSTDAPFTDLDPWRAVAAAVQRRTRSGVVLGADERLPARRALDLFLTPPASPGGSPRRVAVGEPADLCLLAAPLDTVLADPATAPVRATVIAGDVVHLTE